MADVASFVNRTRSRVSVFLAAMEDIIALQTEFTALGGTAFTDTFNFGGENASVYDMTQAEFTATLTALGQIITAYQNGALTANATRQRDLYRAKVS